MTARRVKARIAERVDIAHPIHRSGPRWLANVRCVAAVVSSAFAA